MNMCLRKKKKQYLFLKDSMAKQFEVLYFLFKTDPAQLTRNSFLTNIFLLSKMLQVKML